MAMKYIGSTKSFVIAISCLVFGFIFKTFFPSAPFDAYATAIVTIEGAYLAKRAYQKRFKGVK
ncbi:MAG: hypothetical protein J7L26_12595 [Candidatus Aminicenantes bacterium]|nr:hypothetical protein [Candidatus Aminicenantes bacterium]